MSAQVPRAPDGPVAADNIEALAVIIVGTLGRPGNPFGGQPAQVDALRITTVPARLLVVDVDVAVGASRLVKVVPDGDDRFVGPPRHDLHRPGPPLAGHAGRPEAGSDRLSVRFGDGRHAGIACTVVEADVLEFVDSVATVAARPAPAELDAIAAALIDETCTWFFSDVLVSVYMVSFCNRRVTTVQSGRVRARTERGSRDDQQKRGREPHVSSRSHAKTPYLLEYLLDYEQISTILGIKSAVVFARRPDPRTLAKRQRGSLQATRKGDDGESRSGDTDEARIAPSATVGTPDTTGALEATGGLGRVLRASLLPSIPTPSAFT